MSQPKDPLVAERDGSNWGTAHLYSGCCLYAARCSGRARHRDLTHEQCVVRQDRQVLIDRLGTEVVRLASDSGAYLMSM